MAMPLAELEDLRIEASKRGWWSIYGLIANKRTGARSRRQDRLSSEPEPLRLGAVISEAVLQRCVRDPLGWPGPI